MRVHCLIVLLLYPLLAMAGSQEVRQKLQGFEWQPEGLVFTEQDLPHLMGVVESEAELPFIRRRALQILGNRAEPVVEAFLLTLIAREEEVVLRHRAVEALCQNAGQKDQASREQLKAALHPLLEHSEAHLRIPVARCLMRLQSIDPDEQTAQRLLAYRATPLAAWEKARLDRQQGGYPDEQ